MQAPRSGSVTQWLVAMREGDQEALSTVMSLLYDELRSLAEGALRRERGDHTLQATALVHEAYLRLVDQTRVEWQHRAHFLAIAAQAMRRILVDHARRHHAAKRGGGHAREALPQAMFLCSDEQKVDLLALDEALSNLAKLDPQQGKLVELRFFGGLTNEETAEAMGVSVATIKREWTSAKAFLHRELSKG